MQASFVRSVFAGLLADGTLSRSDAVLAVCAGAFERELLATLRLSDAVITNLDPRLNAAAEFAPFTWKYQDAQNLDFPDGSFDFACVVDGLHHCASPHRALLEMYRVSRKGVIVIEARDSLLMRAATRFGFSPEYEVEAVIANRFRFGGVDNTEIPNYIYRWTEADFMKTIRSYDPLGRPTFRFFHSLNLPYDQPNVQRSSVRRSVVTVAAPLVRAFTRLFPKQCNSLGMVALKPAIPDDLWPWLTVREGEVVFDREYLPTRS
jgi:SAM-dependent methyltransferase